MSLAASVAGHAAAGPLPEAAQSRIDALVDPQAIALLRFRLASTAPASGTFIGGFPRIVQGRVPVTGASAAGRAQTFLSVHADLYGFGTASAGGHDSGLRLRLLAADEVTGLVTFGQTWRGLPVFGAALTVFLTDTDVVGTAGRMIPGTAVMARGGARLDPRPTINAAAAESAARNAFGLGATPLLGRPVLGVLPPDGDDPSLPAPSLVWFLSFEDDAFRVFVDAHTGVIRRSWNSVERGADVELRDAQGDYTICGPPSAPFAGDENGLVPAYVSDVDAQQALAETKRTYDYYLANFAVDSFDNDGAKIASYIHHSGGNAWFASTCANTMHFSNGFADADVLAHEYTHAVQARLHPAGGLEYCNQPGALNESFADVMAALIEGNWTIGEGVPGGPIRQMSNPPLHHQPDHMTHEYFEPPAKFCGKWNDQGWVHYNSGIPNKVWYLLGAGGAHRTYVVGQMQTSKVAKLAFNEMITLPASANLLDARNHALLTAKLWQSDATFGFSNGDRCSVQNAWASVGLGSGDRDCDGLDDDVDLDVDGDWVTTARDNCPIVPNPAQADSDGDGDGDACDADDDGDVVPDAADNCPTVANGRQSDADTDGIGDDCEDLDGDRWIDSLDNCPSVYNPNRRDTDGDGAGDACDPDLDGDGVSNAGDNCPDVSNPGQADTDGGGQGDACDPEPLIGASEDPIDLGSPARTVALEPKPSVRTIALEPCQLPCSEGSRPSRVALSVRGGTSSTRAWVSDEAGNWVSEVALGPLGTLRFRPRPGERTLLNVVAPDGATLTLILGLA